MKRIAFGIAVVAVVVCCSYALAAAVKVALLPYPAASPIEPDASGRAVLNYAIDEDKTEVQVNCWGLTPKTDYAVFLYPGAWKKVGTFTTRKNGSGNLHVSLVGDLSGSLPVAVNTVSPNRTVLMTE